MKTNNVNRNIISTILEVRRKSSCPANDTIKLDWHNCDLTAQELKELMHNIKEILGLMKLNLSDNKPIRKYSDPYRADSIEYRDSKLALRSKQIIES